MTARSRVARMRVLARRAMVGLSMLAVSATLIATSVTSATADPPLTVDEAKAQVAQLEVDAEALDQQYVGVQAQIAAGRKTLALTQRDVQAQTARVARMRLQVGQVALAEFQNRTLHTTAQLFFTSDADAFLNQISTVENVSENQNTVLQDFQAEQAQLATLERSAASDLASLQEQENSLAALRKESDAKITQSKAVLAQLTTAEQQRIAAEERRAAAAAKQQADSQTISRSATRTQKPTQRTSTPTTTVPSSGRGAKALAFAQAQLGKPYRFAAAGPNAYDCSGLTSAAWRAAGVALPRTSQGQYHVGRAVAKSDLQPGDLVFFYSGISHVALYVGHGIVIHAPHAGASVSYIKMAYMPYVGARRPG